MSLIPSYFLYAWGVPGLGGRNALRWVQRESNVVRRERLSGGLCGRGQLLTVQLDAVAPQRAGLLGGGDAALPVEVTVALQ